MQHAGSRIQRLRSFQEGEDVLIYDNRTKLTSKGKILEVLGNNTYLAEAGSGPKHVNGDNLHRVSETFDCQIGGRDIVNLDNGTQDLNVSVNDRDILFDDNISITSKSSLGSDVFNFNDIKNVASQQNVQGRRKRHTQFEQLGQFDGSLQHLRPRNR